MFHGLIDTIFLSKWHVKLMVCPAVDGGSIQ